MNNYYVIMRIKKSTPYLSIAGDFVQKYKEFHEAMQSHRYLKSSFFNTYDFVFSF